MSYYIHFTFIIIKSLLFVSLISFSSFADCEKLLERVINSADPFLEYKRKFRNQRPDDVDIKSVFSFMYRCQFSYCPLTSFPYRKVDKNEYLMKTSKVKRFFSVTSGISSDFTKILELENGVKAVWKVHTEKIYSNYRAEVLAYELDRVWGFNLVPPTVEKRTSNMIGSLQLFVEKNEIQDYSTFNERRDLLRIFDYLIKNNDRNKDNLFISTSNELVAIDNSASFTGHYGSNGESFYDITDAFNKSSVLEHIVTNIEQSLYSDNFRTLVIDYIGTPLASEVFGRMINVVSYYRHKKFDTTLFTFIKTIINKADANDTLYLTAINLIKEFPVNNKKKYISLIINSSHFPSHISSTILDLIKFSDFSIKEANKLIINMINSPNVNREFYDNFLSFIKLEYRSTFFNVEKVIQEIVKKEDRDNFIINEVLELLIFKIGTFKKPLKVISSILHSENFSDERLLALIDVVLVNKLQANKILIKAINNSNFINNEFLFKVIKKTNDSGAEISLYKDIFDAIISKINN